MYSSTNENLIVLDLEDEEDSVNSQQSLMMTESRRMSTFGRTNLIGSVSELDCQTQTSYIVVMMVMMVMMVMLSDRVGLGFHHQRLLRQDVEVPTNHRMMSCRWDAMWWWWGCYYYERCGCCFQT